MIYNTTEHDINLAAKIIASGGIIGMPTETVYGLAANALDSNAVSNIFKAKGRPADNPLIVHIADIKDLEKYAYPTEQIYKIAKVFWPGPLTIVMKKKPIIPDIVSAGLDTVAIRFPSHPIAQELIKKSGVPIAAPSANISGSPSPTTAQHVLNDFGDKINGVIDGGPCHCGVESTVISMSGDQPILFRPGFVTPEQLKQYLPNLKIADAVLNELPQDMPAISPGLKHKHYAPKAITECVSGSPESASKYIHRNAFGYKNIYVICFDEEKNFYNDMHILPYGKSNNPEELASNIFSVLRQADNLKADRLFIRTHLSGGVGLAVYNRLLRACAFHVTDADRIKSPMIIGITGPTGSGKSTFCKIAADYGYKSIDADEVYKNIMPQLTEQLQSAFGDILNEDGSINRKLLAQKAFSNKQSTDKLCRITHPAVMDEIKKIIHNLSTQNINGIIIDAIALIETNGIALCDKTITVYSDTDDRLSRIVKRDNLTDSDARLRINAQKSIDFYIKNTDLSIINKDELVFKREVIKILKTITEEKHERTCI